MKFKDRLGALRRASHLSQADLAEMAEVSTDTLKRWEAGKQSPRLEELIRLAAALGMTVGNLIDEAPTVNPPITESRPFVPTAPKRKPNLDRVVVQYGSLRIEIPATPEGYSFLREKLGDFRIDEIPQQTLIKSLQDDEDNPPSDGE